MCDTYSPKYLGTILGIHRPFEVYPRLQVENCCFLEVLNITSAFISFGREREVMRKSLKIKSLNQLIHLYWNMQIVEKEGKFLTLVARTIYKMQFTRQTYFSHIVTDILVFIELFLCLFMKRGRFWTLNNIRWSFGTFSAIKLLHSVVQI